MKKRNSIKWVITIALSSILLGLAILGGTWGTSYGANAQAVATTPVITSIDPVEEPVGSQDRPLVIKGSGFGDMSNTRVRFYQWGGQVFEFMPLAVYWDTIFINVPADFLTFPNKFDVVVVVYTDPSTVPTLPTVPTVPTIPTVPTLPTIPTIPTIPTVPTIPTIPGAYVSNPVTYTVYGPTEEVYIYLPLILK